MPHFGDGDKNGTFCPIFVPVPKMGHFFIFNIQFLKTVVLLFWKNKCKVLVAFPKNSKVQLKIDRKTNEKVLN